MHGEKVGIGSIASAAIYERVLQQTADHICIDEDSVRRRWPSWDAIEAATRTNFGDPLVADQIVAQQRGKFVAADELIARLNGLRVAWPQLCDRLRRQLFAAAEVRDKLREVGAPFEPEQIGITRERLRESHRIAQQIRNRYTVLDLVFQTGWWDTCVESHFRAGGIWQ